MYQLSKTIVFVGLMGCGKTAIGSLVAERLGAAFLDSDAEIEKAAQMTIAEIFDRDGEPFFRRKEAQVIDRLLTGAPCILSTGGGAYMSPDIREAISRHGVAVWLKADFELLWSRVKSKSTRPLLHGPDPRGTLRNLYDTRSPIYAQAEITVAAERSFTKEDMTTKVISALVQNPQSGLRKVA